MRMKVNNKIALQHNNSSILWFICHWQNRSIDLKLFHFEHFEPEFHRIMWKKNNAPQILWVASKVECKLTNQFKSITFKCDDEKNMWNSMRSWWKLVRAIAMKLSTISEILASFNDIHQCAICPTSTAITPNYTAYTHSNIVINSLSTPIWVRSQRAWYPHHIYRNAFFPPCVRKFSTLILCNFNQNAWL